MASLEPGTIYQPNPDYDGMPYERKFWLWLAYHLERAGLVADVVCPASGGVYISYRDAETGKPMAWEPPPAPERGDVIPETPTPGPSVINLN